MKRVKVDAKVMYDYNNITLCRACSLCSIINILRQSAKLEVLAQSDIFQSLGRSLLRRLQTKL